MFPNLHGNQFATLNNPANSSTAVIDLPADIAEENVTLAWALLLRAYTETDNPVFIVDGRTLNVSFENNQIEEVVPEKDWVNSTAVYFKPVCVTGLPHLRDLQLIYRFVDRGFETTFSVCAGRPVGFEGYHCNIWCRCIEAAYSSISSTAVAYHIFSSFISTVFFRGLHPRDRSPSARVCNR
jgi:hypothetical protein